MARRVLHCPNVTSNKRGGRGGFTLVELALVVAIVGVLAVIALVGYRRYMLSAKVTEGKSGLQAIKIAQEDYRAERGGYANLGTDWCPVGGGVSDRKVGWNPGCGGGTLPWTTLPVHISGAVQFQYFTVAGNGGVPTSVPSSISGNATQPGPWFVAQARCDLDGEAGNDTLLVGMSFTNEIFSQNEGQ